MNLKKYLGETLKEILKNPPRASGVVPVLSGGTALILLRELIKSNLSDLRLTLFLIALVIIFIISAFLFGYLKRIEKDKDQYLLSTVGKIVEDVFRRYGQMMAEKNADRAEARDMNKIMRTIVSLVVKMKNLAEKEYKN